MISRSQILDPEMVRRLGRLELMARRIVEGFISGLHSSPYKGFSIEFAEHRSYVPGDDTRHIDWKVYGKRDRYYVKQYHEETNFAATILLDMSRSMTFASERWSKLDRGMLIAAALSYLVLRQNDAVALGLFDKESSAYLPPGTRLGFLERIARTLERIEPSGATDTARSLGLFARLVQRRGIVVVVSDFLDRAESVLAGLRDLAARGHEVVAFQLLDPEEIDFSLQGHVRFEGIEADLRIRAEPRRIREAYLRALDAHLRALRQGASRSGIDYRLVRTSEPVEGLLLSYLSTRAKIRRVAR